MTTGAIVGKSKAKDTDKDIAADIERDPLADATDTERERTEANPPEHEKAPANTITVQVLRAVSPYLHRGATLTVPDDEFHRGLLKQGNLKAVD